MTRKIALIVSSMHTGGAERIAANLANAWSARGDEVHLLATFSGRGTQSYHLDEGVSFNYLVDHVDARSHRLADRLRRTHALRTFLRRLQPDVAVSFLTNVNVASLIASLGFSFPLAVAEHIYPPSLPISKQWETLRRYTYPLASRVVMLTTEGLDWLQRAIPRARGVVIPNPVHRPPAGSSAELMPTHALPSGKKIMLGAGRLIPQKGFDLLISAFARIASSHPDWVLVILGEGAERASLMAQIDEARLADRILLPGTVGNMAVWYEAADLYVLSSRFEGFPTTLGEAMACGCPVVSYDCDTGPRDMIRHGTDGLLVSPVGDVRALSDCLSSLLREDERRRAMGEKAREIVQRFSMANVLTAWDCLFEDMVRSAT